MRRYVHGPRLDEILRQETFAQGDHDPADPPTGDNPTVIYPHHDHLGSVIALTDAQGQAVEFVRYSAFGQPTLHQATATGNLGPPIPTSAYGNRHLYTGREWLREVSLADHRNRTYSPHLGRWTTTDPIQSEAGDVNLYRYVGNGGIRFVDRNGLDAFYPSHDWHHRVPRAVFSELEAEGLDPSRYDDRRWGIYVLRDDHQNLHKRSEGNYVNRFRDELSSLKSRGSGLTHADVECIVNRLERDPSISAHLQNTHPVRTGFNDRSRRDRNSSNLRSFTAATASAAIVYAFVSETRTAGNQSASDELMDLARRYSEASRNGDSHLTGELATRILSGFEGLGFDRLQLTQAFNGFAHAY